MTRPQSDQGSNLKPESTATMAVIGQGMRGIASIGDASRPAIPLPANHFGKTSMRQNWQPLWQSTNHPWAR